MLRINEMEFRLFRDLIEKECGIFLTDNKAYLIETRLADMVNEYRCSSFGELYLKVRNSPDAEELCALIVDAITTNETSWFRDSYPFQVLEERILPELHREMRADRRRQIRIWSAGCSTGQEPYSIAIAVLDFYRRAGGDSVCHNWVKILATDVSRSSLAAAAGGRYDNTAIGRGLPPECLERYFRRDGSAWVVSDRVRKLVTCRYYNLAAPLAELGAFDIVFLRNVLIYFSDRLKKGILDRVAEQLYPGGCMFLGTGETVSGYSSAFEVVDHGGSKFYRLKFPK